jgi:uncharacterized membrane protein
MATVKKSTQINTPVEKVYGYISDHKNEPIWMPGMIEVNLIKGAGDSVGDQYKWKYKMAGMIFDGETIITEINPNKKIVTESKGGIKSTFTFIFEPNNGATLLSLTIQYTVPVPVLGKIAEKIILGKNEREADLAMENIKVQCENL